MKRPLALLAGSAALTFALAAPAAALDVPPLPVDELTNTIDNLTGSLGLGSADDTDDADETRVRDKVGKVRGENARESCGSVRCGESSKAVAGKVYKAPRNLPKSGGTDGTMLLALAGLGLIVTGRVLYAAGKRSSV